MSWAAPIPMPGRSSMQRPRLVGLVERAGDDDRVSRTARAPRPAGATVRTRWPSASRRPDGRELEQGERALVHGLPAGQRVRVGPDTDRWPRSTKRHGSAGPRLAGVGDADPGRGLDDRRRLVARRDLDAQRRRRGAQVEPGPAGGQPEGRRDEPRAAGESLGRQPRDPLRSAAARSAVVARRRVVGAEDPVQPHRLDALERLDARGPARRPASRTVRSPR